MSPHPESPWTHILCPECYGEIQGPERVPHRLVGDQEQPLPCCACGAWTWPIYYRDEPAAFSHPGNHRVAGGDAVALTLIHPNGNAEQIKPADGVAFQLHELQALVGGYIEVVRLPFQGLILLVDEDGLRKQRPMNIRATALADQRIVGPALVMQRKDLK